MRVNLVHDMPAQPSVHRGKSNFVREQRQEAYGSEDRFMDKLRRGVYL